MQYVTIRGKWRVKNAQIFFIIYKYKPYNILFHDKSILKFFFDFEKSKFQNTNRYFKVSMEIILMHVLSYHLHVWVFFLLIWLCTT